MHLILTISAIVRQQDPSSEQWDELPSRRSVSRASPASTASTGRTASAHGGWRSPATGRPAGRLGDEVHGAGRAVLHRPPHQEDPVAGPQDQPAGQPAGQPADAEAEAGAAEDVGDQETEFVPAESGEAALLQPRERGHEPGPGDDDEAQPQ